MWQEDPDSQALVRLSDRVLAIEVKQDELCEADLPALGSDRYSRGGCWPEL